MILDILLNSYLIGYSVIKKDWDDKLVLSKVDGLLKIYDDGELFVEEVFSENVLFDENKIKNASL